MAKSPNAVIRQKYQQARAVIRREERRELTQREFLDVAFGDNPRTGKPYNTRTLRKWLSNERRADAAVAHSESGGGIIQQTVVDDKGNRYSVTVANPVNRSRLDLYTPTRRADIKRAVKQGARERFQEQQEGLRGEVAPTDSTRQLARAQRLRLAGARNVKSAKHITVIRKRTPKRRAA